MSAKKVVIKRTPTISASFGKAHCKVPITKEAQANLNLLIGKIIIGAAALTTVVWGVKLLYQMSCGNSAKGSPVPSPNSPQNPSNQLQEGYVPEEPRDFTEIVGEGTDAGSVQRIQSEYINGGDLVFFYGTSGVGKSAAVGQTSISFAMGRPSGIFPGEKANNPLPVLWIDTEMEKHNHALRYGKMLDTIPKGMIERITGIKHRNFDDCLDDIRRFAWSKTDGCVVLVDNPTVTLDITNHEKVKLFMRNLRDLQKEYNKTFDAFLTIIVVGHMNKDGKNFTGSKQLENISTMAFELRTSESEPSKRILRVAKDRNGNKKDLELSLKMTNSDNWLHLEYDGILFDPRVQPMQEPVDTRTAKSLPLEKIHEVWAALNNGAKPKELAEKYGVSERTIYRYKQEMLKDALRKDESYETSETEGTDELAD